MIFDHDEIIITSIGEVRRKTAADHLRDDWVGYVERSIEATRRTKAFLDTFFPIPKLPQPTRKKRRK